MINRRISGILTPCKSICQFNDDGLLCKGCYRTREEIENWFWLTDQQKLNIINTLPDREIQSKENEDF